MAALRAAVFLYPRKTGGVGIFCPPPPVRVLTLNRLGGRIAPPPPGWFSGITPEPWPISTWNLAWLSGHQFYVVWCQRNPIRTKTIWDIADFVTSPPSILVRKKEFENSSKIRLWSELQENYAKDSPRTVLRDGYLGFLIFWVFDLQHKQLFFGKKCLVLARVRAGKRTQAIRVRSSFFGCLATLQKRHLDSKGSCLFAGTAGGSWVRCGFCCLFERPKHVFRTFFRVFGCRKRCDLPQGAAIEFSFFPIRKQREFGRVYQARIVYATIVTATLSPLCVYRMHRPWVRSAVFGKSTQWSECWNQPRNPSADSRGWPKGGWHSGIPGSAFGATPTVSLFFGHRRCPNGVPWTRGRLQRQSGAPRLWLESLSVAAAIKATMIEIPFMNQFHSID